MKSQIVCFALILLLAAVFEEAECDVARYSRKVTGRTLGRNVLNPSKIVPVRGGGLIECTAKVTYVTPSKKTFTRVLTTFSPFSAGENGVYSTSVDFADFEFSKRDKVSSFKMQCTVRAGYSVPVIKTVSSSGTANIKAEDIIAYWAVPLKVTGSYVCEGTLKPAKSVKTTGYCTVNFTPPFGPYTIVTFLNSGKRGSFSDSATPYFEPETVPFTSRYTSITVTCVVDTPDGTTIVEQNNDVVTNKFDYNLGRVVIRDNTSTKKYCNP